MDFSTLLSSGTSAATGNPVGAVSGLLNGLLQGHSNWYLMDSAYRSGDFETAANYFVRFYSDPAFNTAQNGKAGFYGDLAVKERQSWIPIIYNNTQREDILSIWKDAVNKGLLPSSGLPTSIGNPSSFLNVLGFNPSVGASLNQQGATPLYSNLPTSPNNGSIFSSPFVIGAAALGIWYFFFKKKR